MKRTGTTQTNIFAMKEGRSFVVKYRTISDIL